MVSSKLNKDQGTLKLGNFENYSSVTIDNDKPTKTYKFVCLSLIISCQTQYKSKLKSLTG